MPEVAAYLHGIHPRSEHLVAATRDLARGRTTPEAVEDAVARDTAEAILVQEDAGLDLVSDGLLRWHDLFRPLVDASEGLRARGLVRWFNNNAFFRVPEVTGSPRLESPGSLPYDGDGTSLPKAATLPSPYVFSRAAIGGVNRDSLMVDLGRHVLGPAAGEAVRRGYRVIHLEEPWLAFVGIDEPAWDPFREALSAIREATGGRATLVLHTYYGDAAPHAERLRRLPVDAVGVDFVETGLEDLDGPWDTGLVAGCLDGRRSVLEDPVTTAAFVRRVVEALEPSALYLSSGSDLELLPREVADRKVAALGEVAASVREALR